MTAAVFQSMISEKGSSQPLLSITGTHAAWETHREESLDMILHKHNHSYDYTNLPRRWHHLLVLMNWWTGVSVAL